MDIPNKNVVISLEKMLTNPPNNEWLISDVETVYAARKLMIELTENNDLLSSAIEKDKNLRSELELRIAEMNKFIIDVMNVLKISKNYVNYSSPECNLEPTIDNLFDRWELMQDGVRHSNAKKIIFNGK